MRELLNTKRGWMKGFSSTSIGSAWLWSVGNIQQGANREGMFSWGAFPRREWGHVCFPGQLGQGLFQAAPFAVAVGSVQGKQWHRLLEVRTLWLQAKKTSFSGFVLCPVQLSAEIGYLQALTHNTEGNFLGKLRQNGWHISSLFKIQTTGAFCLTKSKTFGRQKNISIPN